MNAVQALYLHRKRMSTKPFNARGKNVERCELCRVSVKHCICELTPKTSSEVGFLLLMYDTEILKPSNTGRLVADIVNDTFAFLWSRTDLEQSLLDVLENQDWQPFIVFPHEYVEQDRDVYINQLPKLNSRQNGSNKVKRPLFVLLDGSWREARKMFRKSPYLDKFPVISFQPTDTGSFSSGHYIRESAKNNQLATAEVAAAMLAVAGEHENANLLATWFDVFNYQYQLSVCQLNKGDSSALERFKLLINKKQQNDSNR
jgi:tRNA-uridine aminocarboxypropyltransferase